jgi:predicted lipid-binding transport protein (Tim44 family)
MRNTPERERLERDIEYRREVEISRNNANAAGGFALGIALIALVGVVIAMFIFSDRNNTRTQQNQAPQAAPTINVQPPDVNVTVPAPQNNAPATENPPVTAPAAPDATAPAPAPAAPAQPTLPREPLNNSGGTTTQPSTAPAQP